MQHVARLVSVGLLAVSSWSGIPTADDQVHLRDGKVVTGTIKAREKAWVEIAVDGKPQRIQRARIAKITDAQGHIRWVDAYKFETAHYSFTTNLPRERADLMAAQLETFYGWFLETFGSHWKLHHAKRMGVNLYRTRKEFETAWQPIKDRMPLLPGGFYSPGDETLFLPDEPYHGRDYTKEALFHEGGHQIIHLAANFIGPGPGEPRYWIVEAIPSTFEGLEAAGGKLVPGIVPERVLRTAELLRTGKAHSLVELDALPRERYLEDEYCEGCCLAYFFMTAQNGELRKPFLAYAREVFLTRCRPQTFKKLFGKELAEFEPAYREFVLGLEKEAREALGRKRDAPRKEPRPR